MKVYNARSRGKNFIRVCLRSGTMNSPLGDEEVAVFCQCDEEEPSIENVDIKGLLKWANSNPTCIKNQSNESFRLSKQEGSIAVVYLTFREISCCQSAGRIYPRLAANF
jgi:hypothetical protein